MSKAMPDSVLANQFRQHCRENGCEYHTPFSTPGGAILLLRLHYKCKHKGVKINFKELAAAQAKPNSIVPNSRSKLSRENSSGASCMFRDDDPLHTDPYIVYNYLG